MPRTNKRLSASFGHAASIRQDGITIHPAAAARTAELLAAWECSENNYHHTLDVRPLPGYPHVAQAEWVDQFAKEPYIRRGYIVRVKGFGGVAHSLYHASTLADVRSRLRSEAQVNLPNRLPSIFARCSRVTFKMVRRMGWCEPGIRAWWARFAKRPFVTSGNPGRAIPEILAACRGWM